MMLATKSTPSSPTRRNLPKSTMATEETGSLMLVPSQTLPKSGASPGRGQRRSRGRGKPRPKQDCASEPSTTEKPEAAGNKDGTKPKPKRNRKRPANRKKYPWRCFIPRGTVDPITLESLFSLPYPPFALAATPPYEPVPEWPVSTTGEEKNQIPPAERSSEEERQRLLEQWGKAVPLPAEDSEQQKPDSTNGESPKQQHYNLFDGRALAYYLVSQLQFIDPFNRRDLTRNELLNLDAYLAKYGFKDLKVTEAYDAKGVTLSTAGSLGNTAAGRAAILQQEAQVLLNAMFGGGETNQTNQLQQQYAASQRRQRRSTGHNSRRQAQVEDAGIYGTEDGGMVIIDDDANPGLRGQGFHDVVSSTTDDGIPSPGAGSAPNTLWSASHLTANYSHSARVQAQNFPALPTSSPADSASSSTAKDAPKKGPSKSLQRITKVVVPTNPAEVQRQREAREEAQRRAMLANLSFVPPGAEIPETVSVPGQAPIQQVAPQGPSEGQLLRNQAFASALGVAPSTVRRQVNEGWVRPTESNLDEFGNELNAAQYPDALVMEARERMEQLLKVERKWKAFLQDDTAASLPLNPMDRPLRTFVHEYSDFWKLNTESFDHEPKRYIHCVKLRDTSAPIPLLSEVARNWRGPRITLPRGPRDASPDHVSRQTAGQATQSREFPPAPPREPLKLKPRSAPVDTPPIKGGVVETTGANKMEGDAQPHSRFDGLFSGRERPKLALAPRTLPPELPPYQPPKVYNVEEERERQKTVAEEKARKALEEVERKRRILENAFASSDEEKSLASAGSSEWEEEEEQYSGSDSE